MTAFVRLMYHHHLIYFTPFARCWGFGRGVKAVVRHVGLTLTAGARCAGLPPPSMFRRAMVSIQLLHLRPRLFGSSWRSRDPRADRAARLLAAGAGHALRKYPRESAAPAGRARMTVFPHFPRYMSPRAQRRPRLLRLAPAWWTRRRWPSWINGLFHPAKSRRHHPRH